MEDFEKEFDDAPAASNAPSKKKTKKIDKSDESDNEADGGDEGEFDEVNEVDEEELGENPFAAGGSRDVDAEAWLGSDRDYTYEEVRAYYFFLEKMMTNSDTRSSFLASSACSTHPTHLSHLLQASDTRSLHHPSTGTEIRNPCSQTLATYAGECIVNRHM